MAITIVAVIELYSLAGASLKVLSSRSGVRCMDMSSSIRWSSISVPAIVFHFPRGTRKVLVPQGLL